MMQVSHTAIEGQRNRLGVSVDFIRHQHSNSIIHLPNVESVKIENPIDKLCQSCSKRKLLVEFDQSDKTKEAIEGCSRSWLK
jgi:hypothetical protein